MSKKDRKLSLKQKQFVKAYIENGGNATKAALETYNVKNYNTAHAIASENLQKPTIKQALGEVSERGGITNDYIFEKLKTAAEAGLGINAKNSDSLNALALMVKINGLQPPQKTAHLRIEMKKGYGEKSLDEIQKDLESLSVASQELLALSKK